MRPCIFISSNDTLLPRLTKDSNLSDKVLGPGSRGLDSWICATLSRPVPLASYGCSWVGKKVSARTSLTLDPAAGSGDRDTQCCPNRIGRSPLCLRLELVYVHLISFMRRGS